jgi:nucleotide-binding universal stress UspA family protein
MSASIVCGVDGLRESARAAAVAARLARDLGSRAVLVHVDEDGRTGPLGAMPRPGRARQRRRALRTTVAECCFPDGTEVRLRTGDPVAELMSVAAEEDAELIVVSTGGGGSASPWLIGGTVSALMRRAECPLVVVPARSVPPMEAEGLRDVVCALERGPWDEDVLQLAGDLAERLGGEMHVADEDDLKSAVDQRTAGLLVVGGPGDANGVSPMPLAIALAAKGEVPVVVLPRAAAAKSPARRLADGGRSSS